LYGNLLRKSYIFAVLAPSTKGQDGLVRKSDVQAGTLDASNKKSFPVELIAIMRRQAVDLLLGNSNDQEGRDALRFILSLANARNDIEKIKKGEVS